MTKSDSPGIVWPLIGLLLVTSLLFSACQAHKTTPNTVTPALAATLLPDAVTPPGLTPPAAPGTAPAVTVTPGLGLPVAPGVLPDFTPKLRLGVLPVDYLQNTCQALWLRWNPGNSPPGTVVVPVMFHSIAKSGEKIREDTTISADYFNRFTFQAHKLGFETITVAQLVDFLNHNTKIPPRSLLMIVDDRRTANYFQTYFAPLYQSYHWTVTNAWISNPSNTANLWNQNAQLEKSGLVDHQAHGVVHNIPINDQATPEYIHGEIYGPIQAMLDHFGKRPIAFIWPQGEFTPYAVNLARQAGYELGFTAYSRGPIMFDWIPLGSIERGTSDPLMVLPRYWSTAALGDLDEALRYSQAAQAFYASQKQAELAYYAQNCTAYPAVAGQ